MPTAQQIILLENSPDHFVLKSTFLTKNFENKNKSKIGTNLHSKWNTIELISETGEEETDWYLYVNFEPFFWTVDLMEQILEKLKGLEKDGDDM